MKDLRRVGTHTALPGAFTARWDSPDDHTVEMDIAVEGGQPVCNVIRVERNRSRPPLSGSELRRIPVANWVTFACAQAALRVDDMGEGETRITPVMTEAESAVAVADIEHRVKRRRLNHDLLRDVAATYMDSGGDARVVAEKFYVSPSQAFRYVKKAREAGLITEGS